MRVGALDRRITIQRVTEAQNSIGEPVGTWATLATVWAAFRPTRGREYFEAAADQGELTATFRIRWSPSFTPRMKDRVSFDSRIWDIEEAAELGRREGWDLMARAHTD